MQTDLCTNLDITAVMTGVVHSEPDLFAEAQHLQATGRSHCSVIAPPLYGPPSSLYMMGLAPMLGSLLPPSECTYMHPGA